MSVGPIGCGGAGPGGGTGGPDDGLPEIVTVAASGTVRAGEIGGTGLVLRSALQGDSPLSSEGGFSTRVASTSAQALFAMDQSGALRGLAVSIPGTSGATSRASLAVDAESTAFALMLLVPGITVVTPAAAAERLAELKTYTAFTAFVEYLRQQLPTKSIDALNAEGGAYEDLYADCAEAWLAEHPVAAAEVAARETKLQVQGPDSGWDAAMDVTVPASPPGWPKAEATVENGGWRYVDVRRRDVKGSATANWSTVAGELNALQGVGGFTWGSLFTATFESPNTRVDAADFSGIDYAEYWIRGPGFKEAYANMPPGAPGVGNDPLTKYAVATWGQSIVMYLVLPIISLVTGIGDVAKNSGKEIAALASDLWQSVAQAPTVNDSIQAIFGVIGAVQQPDARTIARLVVDTALLIVGVIAASETLAASLGVAAYAPAVALGLAAASVPLSLANAIICVGAWSQYSWCTKFVVRKPTYGLIVKAMPLAIPSDGRTLSTITATVRNYAADQEPSTNPEPTGDPVEGVQVNLSTSVGTFTESGSATYSATSDVGGSVTCHLISSEEGAASIVAVDETGGASDDATVYCGCDAQIVPVTVDVEYRDLPFGVNSYNHQGHVTAYFKWVETPGVGPTHARLVAGGNDWPGTATDFDGDGIWQTFVNPVLRAGEDPRDYLHTDMALGYEWVSTRYDEFEAVTAPAWLPADEISLGPPPTLYFTLTRTGMGRWPDEELGEVEQYCEAVAAMYTGWELEVWRIPAEAANSALRLLPDPGSVAR